MSTAPLPPWQQSQLEALLQQRVRAGEIEENDGMVSTASLLAAVNSASARDPISIEALSSISISTVRMSPRRAARRSPNNAPRSADQSEARAPGPV